MKILLLGYCFLFISIINFSFTQSEVKANSGSFEEFYPWNDGYLGIAHTLAYAVVLKPRKFQYYDQKGNFKWETKITPYNTAIDILVGEKSDYAYLINSTFTKTALVEKSSSTEFISLYQVDRQGVLKTHTFKFKGEFECLKGGEIDLEIKYLDTYDNGIVIITNNPKKEGQSILFTISKSFKINKVKIGLEWNEEDWIANKISKLNFAHLNNGDLSIIQTSIEDDEIFFDVETYNLNDITEFSTGSSSMKIDKYIFGSNLSRIAFSSYSSSFVYYVHTYRRNDTYVSVHKLGSLFDYQIVGDKLFAIGMTYKDVKEIQNKNPNGFCYFPLQLTSTSTIDNEKSVKFQNPTENHRVTECSISLDPELSYVVEYKRYGYKGCINDDPEKDLPKKIDVLRAMAINLNVIKEGEFDLVCSIFKTENSYVVLEKSRSNAAGGSKKYTFKKIPIK